MEPPFIRYLVGHVVDELAKQEPKSVQVGICSPPYLGARLYSGIQKTVWGAREGCEHDWRPIGGPPTKNATQGSTNGIGAHPSGFTVAQKGGVTGTPEGEEAENHECSLCGAVQCALGREPLHDCLGWAGQGGPKPPCQRCYVCHFRMVAAAFHRVLRDDGVWFLNLGDGFVGSGGYAPNTPSNLAGSKQSTVKGAVGARPQKLREVTLPDKNLFLTPYRVGLALQADGWFVRQHIYWLKKNPMPEPAETRPTNAMESIWLLSKEPDYYYDAEAVREPLAMPKALGHPVGGTTKQAGGRRYSGNQWDASEHAGRNQRNYWLLDPEPSRTSHVAAFPSEIPRRAIKAGSSEWGACSDCSAPWRRNMVRERPEGWKDKGPTTAKEKALREESKAIYGGNQKSRSISDIYKRALKSKRVMKGWVPTCRCRGAPETIVEPCLQCDGEGKTASEEWDVTEEESVESVEECAACDGKGTMEREVWPDQKVLDDWPRKPCVVMDFFAGSGTSLRVARELGRSAIGIDITNAYREESKGRLGLNTKPLEAFDDG